MEIENENDTAEQVIEQFKLDYIEVKNDVIKALEELKGVK